MNDIKLFLLLVTLFYGYATIRWGFEGYYYLRRCGYMEQKNPTVLGAMVGGIGFSLLWWMIVPIVWLIRSLKMNNLFSRSPVLQQCDGCGERILLWYHVQSTCGGIPTTATLCSYCRFYPEKRG